VTFLTAGGGGYGDPEERSRDDIERDLIEGFVSPEAATDLYGWGRETPRNAPLKRAVGEN
jgi:N-methylhydantoinase B